jgi:microcystin-dependent protein
MSQAFLGEVRAFGFNFAPLNWAWCNGQILAIQQNSALFSLLGTNYGGNGTSTFGLPNVQDRIVVGAGTSALGTAYAVGQSGGSTTITIGQQALPAHTHAFSTATVRFPGDGAVPGPKVVLATGVGCTQYVPASPAPTAVAMSPSALAPGGGANSPAPHNNMAPFLAVNWCICLNGLFPVRP